MDELYKWILRNKILFLIIVAVLYILLRTVLTSVLGTRSMQADIKLQQDRVGLSSGRSSVIESEMSLGKEDLSLPVSMPESPPSETKDRLVVRESTLSMVVKDVSGVMANIQKKTESIGGFLVSMNLEKPIEVANGIIVIRIPHEKIDEALNIIRGLAQRVVSENISGSDVTDEYVDLEAKLATLTKTKQKFEAMIEKAEKVQDILQVEQEIERIQERIDSVIGRKKYLEQTAKLSKITVYLSTDELALPYMPEHPWRPKVIFKLAVRSLFKDLQSVGSAVIWIGIYSIIWFPVLLIYLLIRKRYKKRIT